jgi:high-affinity iron transporter
MDFTTALPTFLITLREGVEAALVVGIVLACLQRAGQGRLKVWVYLGIAVGIALSAIVGIALTSAIQALSRSNNPYAATIELFLEAGFGGVAIVMLSWMLIWMTKQAKFLKSKVEGAVDRALQTRAGWGIFSLVVVAILREGFESILFIIGKFDRGLIPAIGAVAGIAVASLLGMLLFKWGVKIDLRRFFFIMGTFLVFIIAGLVVTSLGNLDEALASLASTNRESASICFFYERFTKVHSCVLGNGIWNLRSALPQDGVFGGFLNASFGYTDRLYFVQAIAYLGFLGTIGTLYFRSLGGKPKGNRPGGDRVATN